MGDGPVPRAYEVVVGWVEGRILNGELHVGDTLPAERHLAAQLGVSRAAVREAVRTLQAQGVLRSGVGAGETGGTRVTAMSSGALTRLLRLHVALAHFPLEDVLEVRVALERLSVRLASSRATPDDLAGLQRRLVDLQTAESRAGFDDADAAFHVAIAEAAGNRLAAETTIAIRESVRGSLMVGFASLDEEACDRIAGELNAEHEAILAALVAGDGPTAQALMEAHIRTAWERIQAALPPGEDGRHTSGAAEPRPAGEVTMGA